MSTVFKIVSKRLVAKGIPRKPKELQKRGSNRKPEIVSPLDVVIPIKAKQTAAELLEKEYAVYVSGARKMRKTKNRLQVKQRRNRIRAIEKVQKMISSPITPEDVKYWPYERQVQYFANLKNNDGI